jgi:hypothetical protein
MKSMTQTGYYANQPANPFAAPNNFNDSQNDLLGSFAN